MAVSACCKKPADNKLENLELDLGVVGPAAFGREVQNHYHQLIGANTAQGWDSQIRDEPGLMLTYEREWRAKIWGDDSGIDIIPGVGATLGNVFTYGEAGALLRIGNGLNADYGPVRVRPALSGTDFFAGDRAHGEFGYYAFAGMQGRVVGRNIFLDGNSFRPSPSVDKKYLGRRFPSRIFAVLVRYRAGGFQRRRAHQGIQRSNRRRPDRDRGCFVFLVRSIVAG